MTEAVRVITGQVEVRPYGDGDAGVLRRAGKVVGCWYVLAADTRTTMHVLHRGTHGRPGFRGFDVEPGRTPADAVVEALSADPGDTDKAAVNFGLAVSAWAVLEAHRLRARDDADSAIVDVDRAAGRPYTDFAPPRPDALHPPDRDVAVHRPMTARAARAFLATLDPDALALVSGDANCRNTHLHGLYEGLDGTFSPGAPLRRCLAAHPGFGQLWAETWQSSPRAYDGQGDVDAFLHALLREALGPRAALDLLPDLESAFSTSTLATPPYFSLLDHDLAEQVDVLSSLPAPWRPGDAGSWSTWVEYWQVIDTMALTVPRAYMARYLDVHGDWARWAARLDATTGQATASVAFDVQDMLTAFEAEILRPCLARVGSVPERVEGIRLSHLVLQGGSNLRNCLRASMRWHALSDGILRVRNSLRGPDWPLLRWSPGFPDHREGDLEIRFLTDESELADEGADGPDRDGVAGMGHCVGSYGEACLAEGVRVASVRRLLPGGDFERLSTVEMDGRSACMGYVEVAQHQGRGNGPAPVEAETLVADYVEGLCDGTHAIDETAFARREGIPRPDPAGYPSADDACLGAMLEAWGPCLPSRFRGLAPDDMARLVMEVATRHPTAWWVPDVMAADSARHGRHDRGGYASGVV